jgi:hypothetical protein
MTRITKSTNQPPDPFSEFQQIVVRLWVPVLIVLAVAQLLKLRPTVEPTSPQQQQEFKLPLPLDKAFHNNPTGLAGLCILIAFLTSAVVQIQKSRGGMRARVHRTALKDWLTNRLDLKHIFQIPEAKDADVPLSWTASEYSGGDVEETTRQIEEVCAASDDEFYDLPTTQFCGQIGTAIDLVVLEPRSYPKMFIALMAGNRGNHQAAVEDFLRLERSESKSKSSQEDKGSPNENENEDESERDNFDRLRARVSNYAQRALDSLQIQAARKWTTQLTWASLQASFGISLATVFLVTPLTSWGGLFLFLYSTCVCAAAGALLAPITYDIISGIKAFGKR